MRVYAEADTRENTDKLATEVAQKVVFYFIKEIHNTLSMEIVFPMISFLILAYRYSLLSESSYDGSRDKMRML